MNTRPQIVVRYNDEIVNNRFDGERDLLIEWVSAFVWDNYRGEGFDLTIRHVDGHLRPDEWLETENLSDSWVVSAAIYHKFTRIERDAA